jgi:hypothetical protein
MFYMRKSILYRDSLESAKNCRILKSAAGLAMQSQAITLHSIGIQSPQRQRECRSPWLAIGVSTVRETSICRNSWRSQWKVHMLSGLCDGD